MRFVFYLDYTITSSTSIGYMLSVGFKYSMRDLICGVSYCARVGCSQQYYGFRDFGLQAAMAEWFSALHQFTYV